MPIEHLGSNILFEDPAGSGVPSPIFSSPCRIAELPPEKNAYFPGLAVLPSGDLLALLVISESFESADATTWVARSIDRGRTWNLEGPLRELSGRREIQRSCTEGRLSQERGKLGVPAPQSRYAAAPIVKSAVKANNGSKISDYLKPTVLRDGSVIAIGYGFYRHDPGAGIVIADTGGVLPGEDFVTFSCDQGKSWTPYRMIPRSRPELYEISGPCIELRSGDLLAVAAPFRLPDGSNPSGRIGILMRSKDKGMSWRDEEIFFRSSGGNLTPYESRICEMESGRLVAIVWAYDTGAGRHHPNHIVVSHDDGRTWSEPLNTGIWGQASNLIWLGGDRLLTIHAHRGNEPGIYVRLVDLKGDRWTILEETAIYGTGSPMQTKPGQSQGEMFASLKFGQPSLICLPEGMILAAHWAVERGLSRIRLHRLALGSVNGRIPFS